MAVGVESLSDILAGPARRRTWEALVAWLDACEGVEALEDAVDTAEDALITWPWKLRTAPPDWTEALLAGEDDLRLRLVRRLRLTRHGLHAEDVARLVDGPGLAYAWRLKLDENPIGDEGAKILANAPTCASIRELDLSFARIGAHGAAHLAHSTYLTGLEVLDLSGNPLGNEGVRALTGGHALHRLRVLLLQDVGLDAEGVEILASAPWCETLEVLHLGEHRIGDRGAKALAGASWPALRELYLPLEGLEPPGMAALAQAPWADHLDILDFQGNGAPSDRTSP